MASTYMIVLFLAICYSTLASPAIGTTRNLLQFSNMINAKGYSSFDYNGYGCWCGAGSYGSRVVDATDDCCRIHDQCYDRISGGFFGCSPKLVTYDWQRLGNNGIICTDPVGTCDRNACECDKAAVDCYERHRSSYNSAYLKMGSKAAITAICNS